MLDICTERPVHNFGFKTKGNDTASHGNMLAKSLIWD